MTLLLADDDDLLRKSLAYFLSINGYTIVETDNGVSAVELIRNNSFDLIITDLNMPFVSGMEIIHIIREELKSEVPVILLTSSGMESTELEAFALGASEFVSKPFSPALLKMRIEKLMKHFNNN